MVVRAVVTGGVIEEIMVDIQRITDIHFAAVVHHDVRLDADTLDTTVGGQVVFAGRHFDVSAVGDRTHVLHQSFAESLLTDERGAT